MINPKGNLMKFNLTISLLIAFILNAGVAATAEDTPLSPETYPLTTCVVSGEKLGSMGPAYVYVHEEAGKPKRLVKFCCKGCVKSFKKDPEKYLKKMDQAASAQTEDSSTKSHL
jgi:hypothetical protein